MDFSEFERQIEIPAPVYLLVSGDDYLIRQVYELCRNQVDESARSLDWWVFDLQEDSPAEVVNAALTLPWMSKRRWVFVRNAHAGPVQELAEYVKNPSPRSVLVVAVKKRPAGWPRLPSVERINTPDPGRWVQMKVRQEGYRLEPGAAATLVDLVGGSLQLLQAELEKLFLYAIEDRKISNEAILQMTFQSRDFDIFALIKALAKRDTGRTLRILDRLLDSGAKPSYVVFMLYWNFRRLLVARELMEQGVRFDQILRQLKIWSYRGREKEIRQLPRERIEDLLLQIRRLDVELKSTGLESRRILERFVFRTVSLVESRS